MARYIDAEKIFSNGVFYVNNNDLNASLTELINCIYDIPTADVVEVKCRCKDCKHYVRYGRTSLFFKGKNIKCGWCYLRGKTDEEHRMLPFDFCSYGERK